MSAVRFGILLFCGFLLTVACSEDTGRKIVTVYSPHGKEILEVFEKRFEEAYPEIDVQWLDMGAQDALDRVRSEKANPQGDIWWGAPATNFIQAADEGLLQEYRPTWSDQVIDDFKDSGSRWYGTAQLIPVIMFNSQELTAETAPQDWEDLLKPEWKDKVVIRYPLASGTMRTTYSGMIWQQYKDTQSPDGGYEWLRKLDANTKEYAINPTMMFQKVARKEGIVSLWLMSDIMLQVDTYEYPFGYVVPKSGAPIFTDCIALIANGKNIEDAKTFYEFVTNVESTVLQATDHYRIPTRTDIPKDQLPSWIAELDVAPFDIDWKVLSEKSGEWMRFWDENIKDNG